jgi:hypothetical protein
LCSKAKLLFAPGKQQMQVVRFRIRNLKFIAIELDFWRGRSKLKEIMLNIHSSCVKVLIQMDMLIMKRANIAGFVKWLMYACSRSGINLLNKLNAFYHSDILDWVEGILIIVKPNTLVCIIFVNHPYLMKKIFFSFLIFNLAVFPKIICCGGYFSQWD